MKSSRFKKPFIIVLAVIVLLFVAGLIGTPYLIDLGLERWISSRGPEIGKVENIDFNPFTRKLSMDNLVVETKGGRTLSISHASLSFSWKQLFKKQLYIKELELHDTFMLVDKLEESGFRVGGLILNELIGSGAKSDKPSWEVGIGVFELQNAKIEYDTPELVATYHLDRYSLKGLETWNKQKPVQMEFWGRINESPVQVRAEVKPLDAVKTWKGNIVLEKGSLELFAKLEGLQEYKPSGTINLNLDLDVQIQEDVTIGLSAGGTVTLKQFQAEYENYRLQQEQIAWQGNIAGNRSAGQGLILSIDGQLTGTHLALDDSPASLDLMLGAFSWQGKTQVNLLKEELSVNMEADLSISDFKADDRGNDVGLMALKKFNLEGIEISGVEDIRVSQIEFHNLRLLEKTSKALKKGKDEALPLLQVAAIGISKTSLQGTSDISMDTVELQDFAVDIRRNKEGNWQVMPSLPVQPKSPAPQTVPETGKTAGETRPVKFRINSLQASGNNLIHFADESLYRPFETVFKISELKLGGLNSVDAASVSNFKVKGQVGDYGELDFNGTIIPGDKSVSIDTKGTVGALNMVPFSSYTGQIIGYNITSGQMDADITMKVDRGIMDGIFELNMRNLEVDQVDTEKMPEIDNRMDVPLGSALAMLRNKKDEVNLKLELQGDIRSAEFGIQDVINQALAKAMKFATLSYLKYTLQPFGTYIAIAEVVGKAGKAMSKVGLDPVIFPAGEIVLDETANQYLKKIQELLNNRPKLRIELCGRAVEKDRTALIEQRLAASEKELEKSGKKLEVSEEIIIADEMLLDFARERAKLVKESLIKQHSIDHERIFLCLSEIDETSTKEPYVEIRLD